MLTHHNKKTNRSHFISTCFAKFKKSTVRKDADQWKYILLIKCNVAFSGKNQAFKYPTTKQFDSKVQSNKYIHMNTETHEQTL